MTAAHPGVASRRILLILTEFAPSFGGMQTHASYLARHLCERGYQVLVLTYRATDPAHAAACAAHDAACGYPVRRVLSRIGHWHNIQLVRQWQQAFAPDLVYASNVYYGLLRHGPGPQGGAPILARCVGNDVMRPWIAYPFRFASRAVSHPWVERHLVQQFRRWNMPEWVERVLRTQRVRLMQQSARQLTHVLANSAYTAQALAQSGVARERVQVLVGGVDAARFRPQGHGAQAAGAQAIRRRLGLPGSGRLLLTACRLVPKKGLDFLLAQMPALLRQHPDLHLVVIGEGREQARCQAQAGALGVQARVHFVGRVAHEQIHLYYWCADVFVLASRVVHSRWGGFKDAETMGRVLCEANAAGVPVLASLSGGIPSVVRHEDNGLLFGEDDGADFQLQLARLLRDDALRRQLVARGLATAQSQFDWATIIAAHEHAFARALGGSGHPQLPANALQAGA